MVWVARNCLSSYQLNIAVLKQLGRLVFNSANPGVVSAWTTHSKGLAENEELTGNEFLNEGYEGKNIKKKKRERRK